ncbi:MAG: CDP-alcohol phosphatidyltransferase family protein [Alphaproteobacteria bacterium]
MNLPNLISLGRLLSVPVAVYLILHAQFTAAFWLFVVAGLSDAADGFIAKKWGLTSALGAYLDPIADKALLVAVYLALGSADHVPSWLVILVVSRDLIIIGGVVLSHITVQPVLMRPLMISKINTATQIALIAVILAGLGLGTPLGVLPELLIYLVETTTILSGGAYIFSWGRTSESAASSAE